MAELEFEVVSAAVQRFAVQPMMEFELVVRNSGRCQPRSVILQSQIRIEAQRRAYTVDEQARLKELYGPPRGGTRALRSLLWTHVGIGVPFYGDAIRIKLPVPCSYDFNLAVAKYLYGIEGGEIPLLFLFSGTVFYEDPAGRVQIEQIAHDRDAAFSLPVALWQSLMDHYYPNTAWLQLSRRVFDRIDRYKREHGFLSWEETIASLIPAYELKA